ncbi:MAG: hypothetical protein ABIR06_11285 [Cyclobacteriaceae bacterium]
MKNLPWKKIALGTGLMGIALAGIFYFASSPGKKPIIVLINPAFGEYISSYTAGVLPSASPLRYSVLA